MPTAYNFRTNPLSRLADATVATTGEKFAVDRNARVARIKVDVAAYVGVGNSSTIPAADATNTVYHAAGTEDYTLNMPGAQTAYIYVYAVAGSIAVEISFLG